MIYLKWLGQMLLNLFGFLTAPVIFPIAYLFRKVKFVRRKLLWIYFDDEDEFGFDVEWWMGDKPRNFFTAYKWCALRNPAWNLHTLFKFHPKAKMIPLDINGMITKNGKKMFWDRWVIANLKYVDVWGEYSDNKGDFLSLEHSMLGSQFVKFMHFETRRKYWRYSYAGNIYKDFWLELQIGYSSRPTFRLKIKKTKVYED